MQEPAVNPAWNGSYSAYPRALGLSELFEQQVRDRPYADAILSNRGGMSYMELDRRANQLAHVLRGMGTCAETPVGVLMGQKEDQIVAQVAICKVGGTYVPLDPENPPERLDFMVHDARTPILIIDQVSSGRLARGAAKHICVDRDAAKIARQPQVFTSGRVGPEHRTHILYTSGSTGKPKGIEIVARAVTRLVLNTNYVHIGPTDHVGQAANLSFDAAIFEVWGALLNGATLTLLPKRTVIDPHALRDELQDKRITVMFLTAALFDLTAQACPDAFRSLKVLIVGGERCNPKTFAQGDGSGTSAAPSQWIRAH